MQALFGLWNARSLNNKTISLSDCVIDKDLDVVAVTESWLHGDERDNTVLADISNTFPNYNFFHVPRVGRKGGGVFILARKGFTVVQKDDFHTFKTFEVMYLNLTSGSSSTRIFTIYRPPRSKKNPFTPNSFFVEFATLMESAIIIPGHILLVGDFNLHVEDASDNPAKKFLDLLDSLNLEQHVVGPTHRGGHTLDLIITRKSDVFISNVNLLHDSPSDHNFITFNVKLARAPLSKKMVNLRKWKDLNITDFKNDILTSELVASPAKELEALAAQYDRVLHDLLDKHLPIKTHKITLRPHAPWYDDTVRKAKREKRQYERRWQSSKLEVDRHLYRDQCARYNSILNTAKRNHHKSQIEECDDRDLFRLVNRMSCVRSENNYPDRETPEALATDFSVFFDGKIRKIRVALDESDCPPMTVNIQEKCTSEFACFSEVPPDHQEVHLGIT